MLRGGIPYVDFADHKPPLVFAYYAAAQLFGDGMLPVRLLTVLLVVPLVAFCASAFFGHDRRGLAAGLGFLVWSAAFLGHDMLAVNCELLMLGPLALAVVVLRDESAARRPGRVLWQRAFSSAWPRSSSTRPRPGGPPSRSPSCSRGGATAGRGSLGRLALLAAGGLVPPLAAWAVFAGLGAGEAFVYWNWTHNLAYAANPVPPGETAERAAAYLAAVPARDASAVVGGLALAARPRQLRGHARRGARRVLRPRRAPGPAALPPLPGPALLPARARRRPLGRRARASAPVARGASLRGMARRAPRRVHRGQRLPVPRSRRRLHRDAPRLLASRRAAARGPLLRRGIAVRLGLGADVLHRDAPPPREPLPARRLQPGRLCLREPGRDGERGPREPTPLGLAARRPRRGALRPTCSTRRERGSDAGAFRSRTGRASPRSSPLRTSRSTSSTTCASTAPRLQRRSRGLTYGSDV